MLPILDFPPLVKGYGCYFRPYFSKPQYKHFCEYLTGLIVSENVTVTGINLNFVEANDQSSLNKFLTQAEWPETELNNKRLELLQRDPKTRYKTSGCISIDDVIIHKTGKEIQGVGKLYDHSEGRYVLAQNLVTSQYVDTEAHYPIEYRLYFKRDSKEAKRYGFKTKIMLACELVDDAVARGVPGPFVFDSWFLSPKLTKKTESYNRDWVAPCKSNRLVMIEGKYVQIKEFAKDLPNDAFHEVNMGERSYWVFTKTIRLKKLGRKRIVISYDNEELKEDPIYLVTNRKDWEAKKILATYSRRQPIDAFYRDAKQHLGLEDCQLRNLKGIKRHWYLVFLAYSLLKLNVSKSRLSRFVESNLKTIGDVCRSTCNDLLESLVLWIYKQLIKRCTPQQILQVLLA